MLYLGSSSTLQVHTYRANNGRESEHVVQRRRAQCTPRATRSAPPFLFKPNLHFPLFPTLLPHLPFSLGRPGDHRTQHPQGWCDWVQDAGPVWLCGHQGQTGCDCPVCDSLQAEPLGACWHQQVTKVRTTRGLLACCIAGINKSPR